MKLRFIIPRPLCALRRRRFAVSCVLALFTLCPGARLPAAETNAPGYELRAAVQPVVQRGFMPDSSPRSIAVGLPGGLSYCFDAETCRLRYAWSGGFLDMKPTWKDRGAAPPRLVGTRFFTAPDLMPLRVGGKSAAPEVKFAGYTLVNGRPEFRFSVDGVEVKQRLEAVPGGGLQSTLELAARWRGGAFHAPDGCRVSAGGRELERDADGWVRIPRGSPRRIEALLPGPPAGHDAAASGRREK